MSLCELLKVPSAKKKNVLVEHIGLLVLPVRVS